MYSCCFLPVTVGFKTTVVSKGALKLAVPETTGHTLAATLGLLGIYQEEQDVVYQQIVDVVGHDRDPVSEHI